MIATQTKTNMHYSFNVNQPPNIKNISNMSLETIKTVSQGHSKQTINHMKQDEVSNLPVNFFHKPGEYNKMLIRCQAP